MSSPSPTLITVEGAPLECQCSRGKGPAIVLINGAGGPLEGWMRVWEPLSSLGTVMAWNRPGIGASSPPRADQTAEVITGQLGALLLAMEIPGPYVLVGHSLGGLYALHFARARPRDVAGAVLLDATAPEDVAVMASQTSSIQSGVRSLLNRIWPPDAHNETMHVRTSVDQIDALPSFPSVPLAVVTGARPAFAWLTPKPLRAARARHQAALARLSPSGTHILAPRSGHFPQITEPRLVVQTIADVVRAARGDATPQSR